ncbi:MAG: secondary thiamine-phosphate synthase enzyme YjbQ [Euryarchaeota archaeon]|nr:secondary thiamine-phosphate synthase enzyme YjbQ [Euryarchaeota archaeon]
MYMETFSIETHGEGDVIDITSRVGEIVKKSGITDGLVSIFIQGSTAALTTIEYEPGVLSDLNRALSVLAPDDISYAHDLAWGDGNGRSHVKAAIVGPSLSIPIRKGLLQCGTWQQIVLLELDIRSGRNRSVICTVI